MNLDCYLLPQRWLSGGHSSPPHAPFWCFLPSSEPLASPPSKSLPLATAQPDRGWAVFCPVGLTLARPRDIWVTRRRITGHLLPLSADSQTSPHEPQQLRALPSSCGPAGSGKGQDAGGENPMGLWAFSAGHDRRRLPLL